MEKIYYRKLKKEPRVFIPSLKEYAMLDLWGENVCFAVIEKQVGVYEYVDYFGKLAVYPLFEPSDLELRFNEECFEGKKEYTLEEIRETCGLKQ